VHYKGKSGSGSSRGGSSGGGVRHMSSLCSGWGGRVGVRLSAGGARVAVLAARVVAVRLCKGAGR